MDAAHRSAGLTGGASCPLTNANSETPIPIINHTHQCVFIDAARNLYLNGQKIRSLRKKTCHVTAYYFDRCLEVLCFQISYRSPKKHYLVCKLEWRKAAEKTFSPLGERAQAVSSIFMNFRFAAEEELLDVPATQVTNTKKFWRHNDVLKKMIRQAQCPNLHAFPPHIARYSLPNVNGQSLKVTLLNYTQLKVSMDVALHLKMQGKVIARLKHGDTVLVYYPHERSDLVCIDRCCLGRQMPYRSYCKWDYELIAERRYLDIFRYIFHTKIFVVWCGRQDLHSILYGKNFPTDILKLIMAKYLEEF